MFARLLGLTVVSAAATVGTVLIAANAVGLAIDARRVLTDRYWDWDTAPMPTPALEALREPA